MEVLGAGGNASTWTYITLFLVSFFDTLIVIGAFFPASLFVVAAGFFSVHTNLNIWASVAIVTFGGLVGDMISYFVGRKGTNWFKGEKKLLKASYLDKGKAFFLKYGDRSIIIGRFLGIIKSIIPFVAGLYRMRIKKFIFLNLVSGLVWTVVHIGIGYILGKTIEVFNVPRHIKFLIMLIPFVLFFLWTVFEYRKKIIKLFKFNKKNN